MNSRAWKAVPPVWLNGLLAAYSMVTNGADRRRFHGLINGRPQDHREAVYAHFAANGIELPRDTGGKNATFETEGWQLMATLYYMAWQKTYQDATVAYNEDIMAQAHSMLPWLLEDTPVPHVGTYTRRMHNFIARRLMPLQTSGVLDQLNELLTITTGVKEWSVLLAGTLLAEPYGIGGMAGMSRNPSLVTPGRTAAQFGSQSLPPDTSLLPPDTSLPPPATPGLPAGAETAAASAATPVTTADDVLRYLASVPDDCLLQAVVQRVLTRWGTPPTAPTLQPQT